MKPEEQLTQFEMLTGPELAQRWRVTPGWVRKHSGSAAEDRIPHIRLGRYVRFAWGSPELAQWLEKRYQR